MARQLLDRLQNFRLDGAAASAEHGVHMARSGVYLALDLMIIDIDKLSEPELIDLNNRIVERLRFMQQARAHATMLRFSIGDRVTFEPDMRGPVVGVIIRYNKKSVSVLTDDGQRWTVAPSLLRAASAKSKQHSASGNIVTLSLKPRGEV